MRVALTDDSVLFREGLAALLESAGAEVVLQARSGDELVTRLAARGTDAGTIDVAIIDIRMPPTFTDEGLVAALAVREQHPSYGVLVLSTYAETSYAARLLENGARGVGYLLKDRVDDVATLLDALERLQRGETVVDPDIVHRLVQRRHKEDSLGGLGPREREVLEQIAQGRSNAGIARQLNLAVKTVERYVAGIFDRLQLEGGADDNRRVLAAITWLRAIDP